MWLRHDNQQHTPSIASTCTPLHLVECALDSLNLADSMREAGVYDRTAKAILSDRGQSGHQNRIVVEFERRWISSTVHTYDFDELLF